MIYEFRYRQTEYRTMSVEADNVLDALIKYRYGEGYDCFVGPGGDAAVLTVDEMRPDGSSLCLFDASTELSDHTDPETAHGLYYAMRVANLCERSGV